MEEPIVNDRRMLEIERRWQFRQQAEGLGSTEGLDEADKPQYASFFAVLSAGNTRSGNYGDEIQSVYLSIYQKLQSDEKLTDDEDKFLRQHDLESYRKVKSIQREIEDYKKKLRDCRAKEEVLQTQSAHLEQIRMGFRMTENTVSMMPMEKRMENTLFKDAKVTAVKNVTQRFIQSDRYAKLPEHIEGIGGRAGQPGTHRQEISLEAMRGERARAKAGYEELCRSLDMEDESVNGKAKPFIAKG